MHGFHDPEPHVRAAHALALAQSRSPKATAAARLADLGRQVIAQARPIALEEPDTVVSEAQTNTDALWWQASTEAGEPVDPRQAIAQVHLCTTTMQQAQAVLDTDQGPSTPGDAYITYGDLTMIMIGVLCALALETGSANAEEAAQVFTGEEPVTIPREVAEKFADQLAEATIENPLSEHTTCGEHEAMNQLLQALEAAGITRARQAQEFQRQGHAQSYVCSNQKEHRA